MTPYNPLRPNTEKFKYCFIYEVWIGNHGNIKDKDNATYLPLMLTSSGYPCFFCQRIQMEVEIHRLVYMMFNDKDMALRDEPIQVHHIDEDKTNNTPSNLINVTRSQHKHLHQHYERIAKKSEHRIHYAIQSLLANGVSANRIVKAFHMSPVTVQRIGEMPYMVEDS